MRQVFADTLYWIAIAHPKDQWKAPALEAKRELGDVIIVTTDEVLSEFATALAKAPDLRKTAVRMVRAILDNPNVKVIPQTRDGFLKGLQRYENRPDKHYSLTDCVSMNVIESKGIREVLTHDHHFQQEGFTVLIQKDDG